MSGKTIAQIRIRAAPGGAVVLTLMPRQFMAKPPMERTQLLIKGLVEFVDLRGEVIPAMEAVRTLSQAAG